MALYIISTWPPCNFRPHNGTGRTLHQFLIAEQQPVRGVIKQRDGAKTRGNTDLNLIIWEASIAKAELTPWINILSSEDSEQGFIDVCIINIAQGDNAIRITRMILRWNKHCEPNNNHRNHTYKETGKLRFEYQMGNEFLYRWSCMHSHFRHGTHQRHILIPIQGYLFLNANHRRQRGMSSQKHCIPLKINFRKI